MKRYIPLIPLILLGCTSQDPEKEASTGLMPDCPIIKEKAYVISDDSLLAIIRSHGDSILELVDAGDVKTATYYERMSTASIDFTSILTNELGQEADTLIWSGSPELTVMKRLYIDKSLGLIYKREIIDTVLTCFEPVFDGGDSSVIVENGVPGGAEIEDLMFNEEEIECEAEPFGMILQKEIQPGQVLVSDYGIECRDAEGTGLVYYRHIRDNKYKNGYWVAERSGWFSSETSEGGAYWSNYHAVIFLKERK